MSNKQAGCLVKKKEKEGKKSRGGLQICLRGIHFCIDLTQLCNALKMVEKKNNQAIIGLACLMRTERVCYIACSSQPTSSPVKSGFRME